MERNNDSDYTKDTADLQQNFILREPAENKASNNDGPRKAIDPLATRFEETLKEPVRPAETPAPEPAADSTNASIGAGGPQARETVVLGIQGPSGDNSFVISDIEDSTPKKPTGTENRFDRSVFDGLGQSTDIKSDRPRFENPSFDDGRTSGGFKDPRSNFRKGESASWQVGQTRPGYGLGEKTSRKKTPKPVTMSKKMLGLLIAGCLLLSALFGFGGVLLGSTLVNNQNANSSYSGTTASKTDEPKTDTAGYTLESSTGSGMTVKEITAAAKDSIVEIRTESAVSDSWMQDYVMEGAGSGVIFSEDGYIMTNNHVIADARKIKVTTADDKEYEAKLIGTDENNDVAVIKVDANGLKAATFGNSDELEVGDLAVAIGNPLGELGGTVTAGIISAKDRALSIDGKTLHLLQTDSSINPGNSGGGLFNDDGQLIGLVVAKSSGSGVEGLGFAIPINTAANVAHQLMDKGYVSGQPSTGMTYQEGGTNGGGFGSFDALFGNGSNSKVFIYSVNGNNAKKAGFQSGDIVLAVDGEEITSFDDLSAIVTSHKVGDKLRFTIQRDGSEKEIDLVLEEKEASSNDSGNTQDNNPEENRQNEDGSNGGFPAIPEDGGGSLFDYFFGN